MVRRYQVIPSIHWRNEVTGATASIYGAVPWTSASEEPQWIHEQVGWTVRDLKNDTVGIGRLPWTTRSAAEDWVRVEEKRLHDLQLAKPWIGGCTLRPQKKRRNPRPPVTGPYSITVVDSINDVKNGGREIYSKWGGETLAAAKVVYQRALERFGQHKHYGIYLWGTYMGHNSAIEARDPVEPQRGTRKRNPTFKHPVTKHRFSERLDTPAWSDAWEGDEHSEAVNRYYAKITDDNQRLVDEKAKYGYRPIDSHGKWKKREMAGPKHSIPNPKPRYK